MQWHTFVGNLPPVLGPISRYLPINRYSVFKVFIYSLLGVSFLFGVVNLEMPYILLHIIVSLVCFTILIDTQIRTSRESEKAECPIK